MQSSPPVVELSHTIRKPSLTDVSAPEFSKSAAPEICGLGGVWEHIESPEREAGAITPHGSSDGDSSLYTLSKIHGRSPWKLDRREEDVYGIVSATERAHDRWLTLAVETICTEDQSEAAQAYRDCARLYKLSHRLERQVLIYDIESSTVEVQEELAHNVTLLLLDMNGYHSEDTQIYLNSNREGLISRLVCSLRIWSPPRRPKDDEVHTTSLVRALLEISGGRVDHQQHVPFQKSTADKNIELLASVFNITEDRTLFSECTQDVTTRILTRPIFSQTTLSAQDLKDRTTNIRHFLCLGFEEGYLNLPWQVLRRFSSYQIQEFNCYLSYTYATLQSLNRPANNPVVLLTWTTNLFNRQTSVAHCQLDILRTWASSEEGENLYKDLIRSAQDTQTVEQLTLIMLAILGYSRLVPDYPDCSDFPLRGSTLFDLDAHFRDGGPGNRGAIIEHLVFAMLRVLSTFGDRYKELVTFLVAVLDCEPPLLHALAGLSDQYLGWRIKHYNHEDAFHFVMRRTARLNIQAEKPVSQEKDWTDYDMGSLERRKLMLVKRHKAADDAIDRWFEGGVDDLRGQTRLRSKI